MAQGSAGGAWLWASIVGLACRPPGQQQLPSQGKHMEGTPLPGLFSLTFCSRQPWHGNSYLVGSPDFSPHAFCTESFVGHTSPRC